MSEEEQGKAPEPQPSPRIGWRSFPVTVDFPADAENPTPKEPSSSEPED